MFKNLKEKKICTEVWSIAFLHMCVCACVFLPVCASARVGVCVREKV